MSSQFLPARLQAIPSNASVPSGTKLRHSPNYALNLDFVKQFREILSEKFNKLARTWGDGKQGVKKNEDGDQPAHALVSEATNDSSTMKFALIPPGEFRKIFTRPRDPAIEPDLPVRLFRITKLYAMSTTEVIWDQFRQFVEATGYQTEAETSGLGGRDREIKRDPKITWHARRILQDVRLE